MRRHLDLTAESVERRVAAGYTQAQAERRPGWWAARTRTGDGSWADVMELRDSEGQLIERMTMEDYRKTAQANAEVEAYKRGHQVKEL